MDRIYRTPCCTFVLEYTECAKLVLHQVVRWRWWVSDRWSYMAHTRKKKDGNDEYHTSSPHSIPHEQQLKQQRKPQKSETHPISPPFWCCVLLPFSGAVHTPKREKCGNVPRHGPVHHRRDEAHWHRGGEGGCLGRR